MPKVSIILPTYNGEKYIKGAIQSIRAQSFSDWEMIIIDDGSTTLSADSLTKFGTGGVLLIQEIVKEFVLQDSRIVYLKNEKNLGIQKSLNIGIREAKGEYIARIDDDDEWCDKDKLKNQVEFLDKNQGHVLIGTGTIVIDDGGRELFNYVSPLTDGKIRKRFLIRNCFAHSSVLIRRSGLEKVGGNYSEDRTTLHAEDYDLFLRLGVVGKLANLSGCSIKWRMRLGSLSLKNRKTQFKNSQALILKYRHNYPNFFIGYFISWLRFVAYGLFEFIPILKIKYFLFRLGKK